MAGNDANETTFSTQNSPFLIVLGKKNVLMQAYGQSTINVQMFHNGAWHDAMLKGVGMCHMQTRTYSQSSSTTLNEKKIVIRSFERACLVFFL
jgi:hypothetical protein